MKSNNTYKESRWGKLSGIFLLRSGYFNNLIYALSVSIILTFPQLSFCQITFFKTFGDTTKRHYDQGCAVLQTEDGGYIIAGEYNRYQVGPSSHYYGDVYLVRTDEYGDTLWTKTYGDADRWEAAYSMDKTGDSGYLISANIQYPIWKLWLIKIDSLGDSVWTRTYPVEKGYCIKKTNDNGFIITGTGINGESDIYFLKIDSQGDTQWLQSYNNSNQDEGHYVQQTSDGGYIIAGITQSSERSQDIWFIKTGVAGDTIWTKIYGSDYGDEVHSICETEHCGYFIAGQYAEMGELGLEAHIWLLRTDSNGDTVWTKKINNGSWGDYAYACKRTSDGGYIVTGETVYDNFDSDIYVIKLDEEGNYQWTNAIGRNLNDNGDERSFRGNDVTETVDGGYIIAGFKRIWFGLDDYQDLCLLKVDNKGQIVGIDKAGSVIPSAFGLLQNYPNPFNNSTNIQFYLPISTRIKVTVYDVLGRRVAQLTDKIYQAGNYTLPWNAVEFSSGIYLIKMSIDGKRIPHIQKVLLLK